MPFRRTRRTRRIRALALACVATTVALAPAAQAMPTDPVGHSEPASVSLGDTAASQARAAEQKGLATALAQERYLSSYGKQVHAPTSSLAGTTGSNDLPGTAALTKAEGDGLDWPAVVIGAGGALVLCLAAFAVVHASRRVRRAPLGG